MATEQAIRAHIQLMQASLEAVEIDGRKYWVFEGDRLLDSKALRTEAIAWLESQAGEPRSRPQRLVQELDEDGEPIRVTQWPIRWCLDPAGFKPGEAERVAAELRRAARDWESICRVRFLEVQVESPTPSEQLMVVRRLDGGGSLLASAFFPWETDKSQRVLRVADGFFDPDSRYDSVGILRHELGHVLGFRHEHIREEADAPLSFAEGWRQAQPMGDYDPRSVMHYVFGSAGSYQLGFTDLDRYHAWEAYPWPDRGPTGNPYLDERPPELDAAPAVPYDAPPPVPAATSAPASTPTGSGFQVLLPLDHLVNLGAGGRLSDDGWITSDEAHLQAVADAFVRSGARSLTLYLHGGLNSERAGVLTAEKLFHTLEQDLDTWPLFFIWESGPVDSLVQSLDAITGQDLFHRIYRKVRKHVIKWRKRHDDGSSQLELDTLSDHVSDELPVGNPEALELLLGDYDEPDDAAVGALEAELQRDPAIEAHLRRIASVASEPSGFMDEDAFLDATGWLSDELVADLMPGEPGADLDPARVLKVIKYAATVLRAVIKRFRAGSDHGFHATLIEELLRSLYADRVGGAMWTQMKDNAAGAYGPEGGAAKFLDVLARTVDLSRLEFNVIGQSAGSIHACHLVDYVARTWPASFRGFRSVTFTAPACDAQLFREKVARNAHRLRHFRIFAMTDEAERSDALIPALPFVYPSSLLYLVSGVCEASVDHPVVGMARFLKQQVPDEDTQEVRRFLAQVNLKHRAVMYSPSPPHCAFTSHGGASGPVEDPLTISTIGKVARLPPRPASAGLAAGEPAPGDFDAFTFQLEPAPSRRAVEASVAGVLGAGWRLLSVPLEGGAVVYEVEPPEGQVPGVADAWERSYALSEALGVAVEPLFIGGSPEAPDQPSAGLDLLRPGWHLEAINIQIAWELAPDKGAGVIIGHPDTGYSRHREIFNDRLLRHLGYDYVRDAQDPEDPLTDGLAGHGTRTAGVLFSDEAGSIPDRPSVNIVGTAPAARLIPYRVARSPVVVRTRKIGWAIKRATDSGARVISISMGGPPSTKLTGWVRYAVERGVIVVVAAGQVAPIVPWPGRLEEVVTVAGHESDGTAWWPSARGACVDVCAPANRVFVATWSPGEPPPPESEKMETSWGTSYATAMTAGVAALWLERHGDAVGPDKGAWVSRAFKQVLERCGLEPVLGKEGSKYWGSGRLDAGKILAAPLPDEADAGMVSGSDTLDDLRDFLTAGDEATLTREELLAGLSVALEVPREKVDEVLQLRGDELRYLLFTDPDERRRLRAAVDAARGVGFGGADPLRLPTVSPSFRATLGR